VVLKNPEPKLPVEPTVIVPPNIPLPVDVAQLGDPLGKVTFPSNGPGFGGGIGTGSGGGVGSGTGGGVGPGEGGGVGGGVFHVGGGVSAPQLVYKVDPEYSEQARKAKFQGTVVLNLVVQRDGSVRDIRIVNSLGLGLDEKAIEAVKQWRFRPGEKNGQAVDVSAIIEVTFRLL
jgi:TonB family protein